MKATKVSEQTFVITLTSPWGAENILFFLYT